MKRILLYGDSIIWGRKVPGTNRYTKNQRIGGRLASALGDEFEVIEEGLRARTLAGIHPIFKERDGLQQFGPIFASHVPVGLVVIMLGTNDSHDSVSRGSETLSAGLLQYFEKISSWCDELDSRLPKVLLVSPPQINEKIAQKQIGFTHSKSFINELPGIYKQMANQHSAHFLNATNIVRGGDVDGIHLSEASNKQLATALATQIQSIFSTSPL